MSHFPIPLVYNKEHPTFKSFESFLQKRLEENHLDCHHNAHDVMKRAYHLLHANSSDSDEAVYVQLALMKTYCMEVIRELKQTGNRKHLRQSGCSSLVR